MSQELTKGHENVIPAQAGIQNAGRGLDSHFRGNDGHLEAFSDELRMVSPEFYFHIVPEGRVFYNGSMSSSQEPSHLLVEYLPLLPRGKALDVAMGKGRNALFLASHGFEVVGLERDEEAIHACLTEAKRLGVYVDARHADLEDLDSCRIEKSAYDVVMCFYFLQRSLIPYIKEALKPGAVLLYETFLIDQHLRTGHPQHREYCLEHNELLRLFSGLRVLFYHEGQDARGTYKASLVAQREFRGHHT